MAYKQSRRWNLPDYTVRGCTMTKNRSKWCHRICEPNADGTGHCGRLAPHAMTSHGCFAVIAAAIFGQNHEYCLAESVALKWRTVANASRLASQARCIRVTLSRISSSRALNPITSAHCRTYTPIR